MRYLATAIVVASSIALAAQNPPMVLRFEVASVKPNHSGGDRTIVRNSRNQFQLVNFSLRGILEYAFDVTGQPYLLIAVPGWADTERYDVIGTVPADSPSHATSQMLRQVLEERFALKVHTEARKRDVYVLRRAGTALGPKLQPSLVDCSSSVKSSLPSGVPACGLRAGGTGKLSFVKAGGATIEQLADALSGDAGRPVVNETRLSGLFDIDLEYDSASFRPAGLNSAQPSSAPSVFTAVREQLGLILQSASAPVDHIVIDHIGRPSAD